MARNDMDGKLLAKRWGVNIKHPLYRETGDWYHRLRRFPGALFDAHGYLIFETEEAYVSCQQLQIKKDVNIPGGISSIPGYVPVVVDGIENILNAKKEYSYERAISKVQEGQAVEISMTRYERDPRGRQACISHHGTRCSVCEMSFEEKYGPIGAGFIHVHHLEPLSFSGGPIEVDPIKDLRPVCPNCHAMLHKKNPILSVEELRAMLR